MEAERRGKNCLKADFFFFLAFIHADIDPQLQATKVS